ncbi:MAG: hypothetical protein CMH62_01350 [Nanoarchaeota archaeon]|nr:hypothetical protein [Nanoarchaeota archaeon]
MTRIIPYELIKHLEWTPGQEIPAQPEPLQPALDTRDYSLDDILRGKTFYSNERDGEKYVGLPIALEEALNYAGDEGIVFTMPELIAAKVKADKSHEFWKKWHTVHTEENIGVDKEGKFYTKNKPVVVAVNGGGILTPDRIRQAYNEGLVGNSARYIDDEFDGLLDGRLPDGSSLNLYPYEDIERGISDLPHKFGVVMPYEKAKETESGRHKKKEFLENPLVIVRNGGMENLEAYYEKAKSGGKVGNWHVYGRDRDASVPQGRLLFLNVDGCGGLYGVSVLGNVGRFVGVAPEARSARE